MLKIGSHVSMSGKKMLLGASEEAASYGANTFMIYTGAPQNTRRKAIEELKPKLKEVIMLSEIEGYSYEECSLKLKCPIGTIKSRIYNAKKELAEKLKDLL